MTNKRSDCLVNRALAVCALAGLLTIPAWAAKEKVLHAFTGSNDGGTPAADLIADGAGNLYGTTVVGGTSANCQGGCGTVFKLTRGSNGSWKETVIHNFQAGIDGKNPYGGVLIDGNGNLYGATVAGGSGGSCANNDGCGTVFKLTPSGKSWRESIIYNFTGGADGGGPGGGLAIDKKGNLYGTTPTGGKLNGCAGLGCGVVYQLALVNSHWKQKVIHTFTGGHDGATGSLGRLLVDTAGTVWGIAEVAGDVKCGCGTVFKLSRLATGKWQFTALYGFKGMPNAGFPFGGVISDGKGALYGTTYFGGKNGAGSVFKLAPTSTGYKETVLYSFQGAADGGNPTSTLVFDSLGNLYGTTSAGGNSNGDGVVFKLTLANGRWKESVTHSFGPAPDGANPNYGLLRDKAGNLYGVTPIGGTSGAGVVFAITP